MILPMRAMLHRMGLDYPPRLRAVLALVSRSVLTLFLLCLSGAHHPAQATPTKSRLESVDSNWVRSLDASVRDRNVSAFLRHRPWCGNDPYLKQRHEHMARQRPRIEYALCRYALLTYRHLELAGRYSRDKRSQFSDDDRLEPTWSAVHFLCEWNSPGLLAVCRAAARVQCSSDPGSVDDIQLLLEPIRRALVLLAKSRNTRSLKFLGELRDSPAHHMRSWAIEALGQPQ